MRKWEDGVLLCMLAGQQQDVSAFCLLASDVLLKDLIDDRLHQVPIEHHDRYGLGRYA